MIVYDCIKHQRVNKLQWQLGSTEPYWIASVCRRISVPFSCAQFEAKKLQGATANNSSYWIVYSERWALQCLTRTCRFSLSQEPTPIRIKHVSNLLHRWCPWRGRRCRSLQAALVKEPIPQVSPDPHYYAADKLFINWRTKNIKIPVKIQPSLWYRALYWNDHTILTSLTDMWIRAYSPRAGWQEALAQPKNITSSPQAFLVTPGTAAGLTVLLVWCCKFYTNHHTALISMWVCIWYSQAEAALQVLVQATLLPTIQHITDQQDLQKDVNFSWLSCERQNVRNRLVALGMIWHPLAASLPANGSWSLILVRVCCSVSDPRLHCLHGPAVRKLFKCIASFHQCCNV